MDMLGKAGLLGLSTGVYCLGFCLPVLFPLVCAESHGSIRTRSWLLVQFLSGRLVAYAAFGAVAGFAGGRVDQPLGQHLAAGSMMILSVLLIAYGVYRGFPETSLCRWAGTFMPIRRMPLVMGLLTGFHVCPPFLLAVGYVFTLGQVIRGVGFFLMFYIVTVLFVIPAVFMGHFAKFESLRSIAQISAILAGGLFFFIGLNHFFV